MRFPYKHLLEQPEYNPDILCRLSSYMENINTEGSSCLKVKVETVPRVHRVVTAILESIDLAYRDYSVNYFWVRKESCYEILFFCKNRPGYNSINLGNSWISLLEKYSNVTGECFYPADLESNYGFFEWTSRIALGISKEVSCSHDEWYGSREKEEIF